MNAMYNNAAFRIFVTVLSRVRLTTHFESVISD